MLIDDSEIDVGEQVSDRLIAGIVHPTGKLQITLIVGTQELLSDGLLEIGKPCLQLLLELEALVFVQTRHSALLG